MSGMVDRRNDRGWWTGKITWSRIAAKNRPMCDDCLLNVHANGGTDKRVNRARHRRKNAVQSGTFGLEGGFRATYLCDPHKQEWLDWTPGQMAFGS